MRGLAAKDDMPLERVVTARRRAKGDRIIVWKDVTQNVQKA